MLYSLTLLQQFNSHFHFIYTGTIDINSDRIKLKTLFCVTDIFINQFITERRQYFYIQALTALKIIQHSCIDAINILQYYRYFRTDNEAYRTLEAEGSKDEVSALPAKCFYEEGCQWGEYECTHTGPTH
jgi:hypothetical protein